jgi:hypothetical protein
MVGQQGLLGVIQTALASPWATATIEFSRGVWDSPAFRLFSLIVFVLATIWVIAKVYSGDLQNAEKGPVAIRRHSAASVPRNTIVVHRNLIPMSMDGVHARCSVYYVYEGQRKKRRRIKLLSKEVVLSVSPALLRTLTDVARGTEVPNGETENERDIGSTEVIWPVLEVENEKVDRIEATPDRAHDYLIQNRVLERWPGDDSLSLMSLHADVMEEVRNARDAFILGRVRKSRNAKNAKWLKRWRIAYWTARRPGAVGNYFLKFQFSNDPLFVLSKHPDRDVRMTAWLTVLTSIFAIVMELFPLNLDEKSSVRAAAEETQQQAARSATDAAARLTGKPAEE